MIAPSSKIQVIISATVIIVSGTIALSQYLSTETKIIPTTNLQTQTSTTTFGFKSMETDTDGDGLRDWQEGLWGTNSSNSDTDSDGTSDGEEADTHRNPLVAGPNDKIFSTSTLATSSPFTEAAKNYQAGSLTDLLSQNLISNYLNFKQTGSFDSQTQEDLINALVVDSQTKSKITNAYSYADLTILKSNNQNEIKLYGNMLAKKQKDNLNLLARIVLRDPDAYIKDVSNGYKKFSVDILKTPVPQDLAPVQLEIANNLFVISQALLMAQNYKKDPAQAVFALRQFEEVEATQVDQYRKIAEFFVDNGIIFNTNEDGALWKIYEIPNL